MEYDPVYDADKGSKVMPSSFHDISDVEFQDNWGRVWYKFLDFLAIILWHIFHSTLMHGKDLKYQMYVCPTG